MLVRPRRVRSGYGRDPRQWARAEAGAGERAPPRRRRVPDRAEAQRGPTRFSRKTRSREYWPGPVKASVAPTVPRVSGNSQPTLLAHGPLPAWTVRAAGHDADQSGARQGGPKPSGQPGTGAELGAAMEICPRVARSEAEALQEAGRCPRCRSRLERPEQLACSMANHQRTVPRRSRKTPTAPRSPCATSRRGRRGDRLLRPRPTARSCLSGTPAAARSRMPRSTRGPTVSPASSTSTATPGEGGVINDEFPAENGEVPLPDWSLFEEEDLVDLDDELRAAFRERAIPPPVHVTSDQQQLSDDPAARSALGGDFDRSTRCHPSHGRVASRDSDSNRAARARACAIASRNFVS